MSFWKKNKIHKFFLLAFFTISILASAHFAYALEANYPAMFGVSINDNSSLAEYAKYFFNIGIAIAVILASIVIAYGGILYMFGLGVGKIIEKVTGKRGPAEAKEWIKAGVAGLLLTVCAYLIAFTINPYLVIFDLTGLAPLTYIANIFNPTPTPNLSIDIYSEIPIGKLTENLLSRPMACYDFDDSGDPIDGEEITTDDGKKMLGPTYLNHDRADCILELSKAAENKAKITQKLSDEIVYLMKSCSCGINSDNAISKFTFYSIYAHMDEIYVSTGQEVKRGDVIGEIGKIGTNMGDHLHFAVGPSNPNSGNSTLDGGDIAISMNIYSVVSTPTKIILGSHSGSAVSLPNWFTATHQSLILSSLSSPVDTTFCNWAEEIGSALHNNYAYWSQDWVCAAPNNKKTTDASVMVMAGGPNIKSTIEKVYKNQGGVLIKHEYTPPIYNTNGNSFVYGLACETSCKKDGSDCKTSVTCKTVSDYNKYKKYNGTTNGCKDSCSIKGCDCSGKTCDRCPAGYKDKIDHGPITIGICSDRPYVGLDEFKSEFSNDYEKIKKQVEVQPSPKMSGETIPIINNGNCKPCDKMTADCLLKRKQCLIKNSPWYKLRLIDQLTYLKGKIEELKIKVKADLESLEKAETELGKCYLADSYVDFLKTYEANDKEKNTILIEQTYSDQDTGELINPAKYCKGFEYNNSTCYSKCKKMCPGNQQKDFNNYAQAKDCSGNMSSDEKTNCLKQQSDQVKEYYNKRSCTPGASSFSTFEECFTSCKQRCSDACDALCSEEEKTTCKNKCSNDSKCIIENEGICAMDFNKLKDCTKNNNYLESLQKCAEDSATCKYCSDQYAGYADCLLNPYSLQNKYSASYIYQHPDYQICTNPNKSVTVGSSVLKNTCIEIYPETAKCPASSKCPDCPCDITSEAIGSSSSGGATSSSNKYRVCSGNCDELAYNDDPLTFYCKTNWWSKEAAKKTNPVGEERLCLKSREVPVGQTVDDSEDWGKSFLTSIDGITKDIQNMVDYMKKIGEEKNYCECNSKCDSSGTEPTCKSLCLFKISLYTVTDPDTGEETKKSSCSCSRGTCEGNPCQKIINMLQGKTSDMNCPKGTEYKGIGYYYAQIASSVKNFNNFIIQEGRSDILKKLNYSRKTTDDCSTTQNNYGETYVQMLSCTRAEDEIISPIIDKSGKVILDGKIIQSYCYGKELGKVSGASSPLMDNWFCCETRKESLQ